MTIKDTAALRLRFTFYKETTNTVRFMEDGPKGDQLVGSIYISKSSPISRSEVIAVSIERA
jgi:hypothetical protein